VRALVALLLLAVVGSAGLAAPWWLTLAIIPGLWASGAIAGRDADAATTPQAGMPTEEVIATIYERSGRLVLRRRTP